MPSLARCTLIWALTVALVTAAPGISRAQGPAAGADTTGRAALVSERQRLRAELEHVNAEIDALKRAKRGMRDDYRLRGRLADAEALARRLTALDARLGVGPGNLPAWPAPGTEPRSSPGDGPAELAAKADILSDQARRLVARADTLQLRAQDLRGRQNLRRRVGQMEHDPFTPLEGSKRRAMASAPAAARAGTPTFGPETTKVGSDTPTPPPQAGNGPPTTTAAPGFVDVGAATAPRGPSSGSAVLSPQTAPTPTSGTGLSEGVSLSVQLRDLLDPTTLAEIRRLEASGAQRGSVETLERAALALKAKAERLRQQAAALRAGQPAPRPR